MYGAPRTKAVGFEQKWKQIFVKNSRANTNEAEMYQNCNNNRVRNTHLPYLFLLHYESNDAVTEHKYNGSLFI